MSEAIYCVTSESLQRAISEIPHAPSRPTFEPIAKSLIKQRSRWDFISEWWYPRAASFWKYPLQESANLSLQRAIQLNRYITNGVSTRSGEYKAIQLAVLSAETFEKRYLSVPEAATAKKVLRAAIENAIRLRRDQVFHDGNHRTALLLLYEVLAEHKLLLQAKPMTLYTMLSNRSHLSEHGKSSWEEVANQMYQHCRSRLKFLVNIPDSDERPLLFANAIKTLDIENSLFNQLAESWFATEPRYLAPERRKMGRHLKRLNRGMYTQFYQLCIRGNWEGPAVSA